MIAIVSSPAKRQLGQIAGADDQTACLVGDVHQDLGSFSGLGIFIRNILDGRIVADIGEVTENSLTDRNLAQGGVLAFRQTARVLVGPVGRAETGHGDRLDTGTVQTQCVKCPYRHQKRQRGIEAAR